jgi:hypothetical protein
MRYVTLTSLILISCGTIAEGNGGAENLPSRHIVPFDKLTPSEFVLDDEHLSLNEPFAIERSGRIVLYLSVTSADETSIGRATSADGESFGSVETVLTAELDWEDGAVAAPTVLPEGGSLLMWYQAGPTGAAIGLARSDDGIDWSRESEPVLVADDNERILSPSVVRWEGGFEMYFAVSPDDSDADFPSAAIHVADSADGVTWTRRGAVLEPGTGCLDEDGEPAGCWDEVYVRSPAARVSVSPLGRPLLDIWYTGGIRANSAIAFAGSRNGRDFVRYNLNPVVNDSSPEEAAALLQRGGELWMYFADELGDRLAIGLAVNPQDPE